MLGIIIAATDANNTDYYCVTWHKTWGLLLQALMQGLLFWKLAPMPWLFLLKLAPMLEVFIAVTTTNAGGYYYSYWHRCWGGIIGVTDTDAGGYYCVDWHQSWVLFFWKLALIVGVTITESGTNASKLLLRPLAPKLGVTITECNWTYFTPTFFSFCFTVKKYSRINILSALCTHTSRTGFKENSGNAQNTKEVAASISCQDVIFQIE